MEVEVSRLAAVVALLCSVALSGQSVAQSEDAFNDALCDTLQGETETRHRYGYGDGRRGHSHVFVDCETDLFVVEGGLDKRTSLDSLEKVPNRRLRHRPEITG